MTSTPPDRLTRALSGRYRLLRQVGSGGMATVYQAEDLRHQRSVAVKVLRDELTATIGAARFLAEIRVTAALQHPHILPLLDSGEVDGVLFYVMPFVEGESLGTRLARARPLPVREAVRILGDLADALEYAHARGVVHRDLKPDNVLLTHGHALLADFGIAKALHPASGGAQATTIGIAVGTPAYMAPEQAAADPSIDHRADIYALGVLGYELLTGAPPFTGQTPQEVLAAQVTQQPPDLAMLAPAVPPPLAATVMRCLAKRPADRWQTAGDILRQVEALGSGSGELGPTHGSPRWTRVHRKAWGRIVLAGGVVLVGAGVAARLLGPGAPSAPDPRRVLVLPFVGGSGGGDLDEVGAAAADRIEQGISEAQLAELVPWRTSGVAPGPSGEALGGARDAATSGLAGTFVVGIIHQHHDSIEIQAQLLAAPDLRVLFGLRFAAVDPDAAIDGIRNRVLGALGFYLLTPERPTRYGPPPSLTSFRALQRGDQLFQQGRFAEAIPHYREAFQDDTSFLRPLGLMSVAHASLGQQVPAETLLTFLGARRERLSSAEAIQLDWLIALRTGSPEREYQMALEGARGDLSTWAYPMTLAGIRSFRPGVTLRYFQLGQDTSTVSGRNWVSWWINAMTARHMLGEDDAALRVAREARARHPDDPALLAWEGRLLASLGRTEELERVISQALTVPGADPASVLLLAAKEFAAHGNREAAAGLFARVVSTAPSIGPAQQALPQELAVAEALFFLARWKEAEARFSRLRAARPGLEAVQAWLGMTQARLGNGEAAARAADSLLADTNSYRAGAPRLAAARILASLGRSAESVAALRRALDEGTRIVDWHLDPALAALRGFRPFDELVRLREE